MNITTLWRGSGTISIIRGGSALFVAACFANRVAANQIGLGDVHPEEFRTADAGGLSQAQVLDRVDAAICSLNGPDSVAWTQAYCDNFSRSRAAGQPHRPAPPPNWAMTRTIRKSPSAC